MKKSRLTDRGWYLSAEGDVWVTAVTPSGHAIGLCICDRQSPEALRLQAGETVRIGKHVLDPRAQRMPRGEPPVEPT